MLKVAGPDVERIFFVERKAGRREGKTRSLQRTRDLGVCLGIDFSALENRDPWLITVVGSKGKGTMATYASAALRAAGLKVGTLTSPGLCHHRDRIRINGVSIDEENFARLAENLDTAMETHRARLADDGYLSPTGLFTLAAMRHFLDQGCDVVVAEAGLGGRSDEVSLFSPAVVAVGAIFAEHSEILGPEIIDIARDKLGVVKEQTTDVILAYPSPEIDAVMAELHGYGLTPVQHVAKSVPGLPPGLGALNAAAGICAARCWLKQRKMALNETCLNALLPSISLPGRLSHHRYRGQDWLLDAAINTPGVAAALEYCRQILGDPKTVLLSIPDGKDQSGTLQVVASTRARVIPLRIDAPHLSYSRWPQILPRLAEIDLLRLEPPVLAVGTASFVSQLLQLLDVDTSHLFSNAGQRCHCRGHTEEYQRATWRRQ